MRGNGRTTIFGQTLLTSDYGADDLNKYRDDFEPETHPLRTIARSATPRPEEAQMHNLIKRVTGKVVTTIALLDGEMPAKVTRPSEAKRVDAKMTRHAITREPDIFDEVAGEAVWFADDMVLVVPLDKLDDFRRYIAARGLAPCGRGTYTLHRLTKDAPDTWSGLYECVTGNKVA